MSMISLARRMGMKVRVKKKGSKTQRDWNGEKLTISRKALWLMPHEMGHYIVAKYLGMESQPNYGLGWGSKGPMVDTNKGAMNQMEIEQWANLVENTIKTVQESK